MYENSVATRSVIQKQQVSTWCEEHLDSRQLNMKQYMRKTLTDEQLRIVKHNFHPQDVVKIIAFAGTGKTTTMVELTKLKSHLEFLLIVYNRAVKEHAQPIFPHNVKCRTAHGLAYEAIYPRYKGRPLRNLTVHDIVSSKALPPRENSGQLYRRAAIVLLALNSFMSSSDDNITMAHVPTAYHASSRGGTEVISLDENMRLGYARDAEIVWRRLFSVKERYLSMPFDGLLKLWQLEKPDLVQNYRVDCIIIDEGQDMNAAMLDVFLNQTCTRIIVGDPHQQIYQFRGAINALGSISCNRTFFLTQSFRFGPIIAFVANSCLEVHKKLTTQTLVGGEVQDELSVGSEPIGKGKLCIIGRTNLALYKKVVDVVRHGMLIRSKSLISLPSPLKLAFAGELKSYEYNKLRDLWYLRKGEKSKIENKFIQRWSSYGELKDYAEKGLDQELLSKFAMVEWSMENTETYVQTIQNQTISSMKDADVIFSTVHKSKGLEWDVVALLDDFAIRRNQSTMVSREGDSAESNLLYVAVTRARKRLILNNAVYYTLLAVNEKMERIIHSQSCWENSPSVQCVECGTIIECTKIALKCHSLILFSGHTFKEGLLCSICAVRTHYIAPMLDRTSPIRDVREDKTRIAFSPFLSSPSHH